MYPLAWQTNPDHMAITRYTASVHGCKNKDCSMYFKVMLNGRKTTLRMFAIIRGRQGATKVVECRNPGEAMRLGNKAANEFLNYIARGLI